MATSPSPIPGRTYTVVVTPPAGYTLTYPTSGTANQASVTISSPCQIVCNLIFAYMGTQTGVSLVKTGPATVACGDTVTYNFAVTNTGNNTVSLSVMDPLLGGQVFSQNSVAPGHGFAFAKTYTTVASNIGKLTNSAWAIANPGIGPNVTNSSSGRDDSDHQSRHQFHHLHPGFDLRHFLSLVQRPPERVAQLRGQPLLQECDHHDQLLQRQELHLFSPRQPDLL